MTSRRFVLTLSVALTGALPAGAAADAPWTEPVGLGPGVARVASPSLTPASPTTTLLTWGMRLLEPATPLAPSTDRVVVATRAADGTVLRRTLRDDVVTQVACGPRCVAVLRQRSVARRRVVLGVSIGSGAAGLGRLQTLARYLPKGISEGESASVPAIAAHPRGAVAVAWIEAEGRRLRVALRRPGAAFGRPRTIATEQRGTLRLPRLAFHDGAGVTLAYTRESIVANRRRRNVEARRVPVSGAAEPRQVVGPAPESQTDLRIATSAGGRTAIAWGNVHGTVMGFESRWVVRAALRARSARRFAAAQVLDPGAVKEAGAPGRLGLGIAADGTATVAWSAHTRALPIPATEVRAASARPGRRFGPHQAVSPQEGYGGLSDLAVAPNGAALLTFAAYGGGFGSQLIVAAVRPAGAPTFGPPEIVARTRHSMFNAVDAAPAAGIDGSGVPTVVWAAESTTGEPPLHAPMSSIVLLSTRSTGAG